MVYRLLATVVLCIWVCFSWLIPVQTSPPAGCCFQRFFFSSRSSSAFFGGPLTSETVHHKHMHWCGRRRCSTVFSMRAKNIQRHSNHPRHTHTHTHAHCLQFLRRCFPSRVSFPHHTLRNNFWHSFLCVMPGRVFHTFLPAHGPLRKGKKRLLAHQWVWKIRWTHPYFSGVLRQFSLLTFPEWLNQQHPCTATGRNYFRHLGEFSPATTAHVIIFSIDFRENSTLLWIFFLTHKTHSLLLAC